MDKKTIKAKEPVKDAVSVVVEEDQILEALHPDNARVSKLMQLAAQPDNPPTKRRGNYSGMHPDKKTLQMRLDIKTFVLTWATTVKEEEDTSQPFFIRISDLINVFRDEEKVKAADEAREQLKTLEHTEENSEKIDELKRVVRASLNDKMTVRSKVIRAVELAVEDNPNLFALTTFKKNERTGKIWFYRTSEEYEKALSEVEEHNKTASHKSV